MLKLLLHFNNLSQSDLSRILGVSRQYVYLWVNNKQKIPEKYKNKISKVFKIQKKYLDYEYSLSDVKDVNIVLKDDNKINFSNV